MPKQHTNPVSDEQVAEFDMYIEKWREKLNLRDWRVVRANKRDTTCMASLLSVEPEHKLARYSVGLHFGVCEVTSESLESTAIHEMLHLRLRSLMDACIDERGHTHIVNEKEHEVVVVLEELLMRAYGGES